MFKSFQFFQDSGSFLLREKIIFSFLYGSAFRLLFVALSFRIPHSLRGVGHYGPSGPEADFRILLYLSSLFNCSEPAGMKFLDQFEFIVYLFFKNGEPFADFVDPMSITAAGPRKIQFFGHLTGQIVLIR